MRRSSFALALLLATPTLGLGAGCGGSDDPAGKAPTKAVVGETKIEPTTPPAVDEPAVKPEDPFADDTWEEGDTDGAEPTPPIKVEPTAGPWPGPCKITYKGGPTLRFKYTDTGGTVRTDADGDGKADVCSKFERADGHTSRVSVDLDCDKKTDFRLEPKREVGTNLAVGKVTATEDNGGNREMTLVELGLFSGVEPGFPLAAAREDVETTIKAGQVVKAAVRGKGGAKIAMAYDKAGRIKSLDEDADGDGTVDRKFTYRYDAKGNVSKIEVTVTAAPEGGGKPEKKKQAATVDYSCWK